MGLSSSLTSGVDTVGRLSASQVVIRNQELCRADKDER